MAQSAGRFTGKTRRLFGWLAALAIVGVLGACGGGGSDLAENRVTLPIGGGGGTGGGGGGIDAGMDAGLDGGDDGGLDAGDDAGVDGGIDAGIDDAGAPDAGYWQGVPDDMALQSFDGASLVCASR